MVFSQDVVVNFCRFLSRHCGGFLPQHKELAGFGGKGCAAVDFCINTKDSRVLGKG